eukprot:8435497-Karenia_brevis.AAC.1
MRKGIAHGRDRGMHSKLRAQSACKRLNAAAAPGTIIQNSIPNKAVGSMRIGTADACIGNGNDKDLACPANSRKQSRPCFS